MQYENAYVWLIFVSCLDIFFTWMVLYRGGREANALAQAILQRFGLPGMVIFKLGLIVGVILISEAIGKRNTTIGRRFVHWAVALCSVPVVIGAILLLTRL